MPAMFSSGRKISFCFWTRWWGVRADSWKRYIRKCLLTGNGGVAKKNLLAPTAFVKMARFNHIIIGLENKFNEKFSLSPARETFNVTATRWRDATKMDAVDWARWEFTCDAFRTWRHSDGVLDAGAVGENEDVAPLAIIAAALTFATCWAMQQVVLAKSFYWRKLMHLNYN